MTSYKKLLTLVLSFALIAASSSEVLAASKPKVLRTSYSQSYKITNSTVKGKKQWTDKISLHASIVVDGHPTSVVLDRGPGHLKRTLSRISRSGNREVWGMGFGYVQIPRVYPGHARLAKERTKISFTVYSKAGSSTVSFWKTVLRPQTFAW